MHAIKAYEIFTDSCRYTLTIYRSAEGRYLAEYCAHRPEPGPLMRVGDLQPAASLLRDHQEFYIQSLLGNCLAEITRESGPVRETREVPIQHDTPGHECKDEAA